MTGQKLCTTNLETPDLFNLTFNPANWRQISGLVGNDVIVWTVENSNEVHVMHTK